MWRSLYQDVVELAKNATGGTGVRALGKTVLTNDSFRVTLLSRVHQAASGLGLALVSHPLRVLQTVLHGIEIGKDVRLGHGVYFVHTLGVVIGGDAKIGDRVRFYGNNTVGTAKDNGYPTIEDDVEVGAGARILGPITVGARSVIGANAVVLTDVPPDSLAVGVPATIRPIGGKPRRGSRAK